MERTIARPDPSPQPDASAPALRVGVVTLLGAATLGVVMLSPAMTHYGNFAAAFAGAGKAAPLPFVWALLATLPTATSYALLSRDFPAAGSAAAWTARALGPAAGRWPGWMVFLYYLTNFVLQPVTFGLFFSDLVAAAGLPGGYSAYALGGLLCCALPAALVYRGISPSTRGALGFLLAESAVVAALCATAALRHPAGPLDLAGFTLAASPNGVGGAMQALVFALLAAALLGPWRAYLWWGQASTFFAVLTFLFVNLCALRLFRDRTSTLRGALLYAALPAIGTALDCAILLRSFFVEAWGQGALGRSAIAFDLACAAAALGALACARGEPRPRTQTAASRPPRLRGGS